MNKLPLRLPRVSQLAALPVDFGLVYHSLEPALPNPSLSIG
jgi:hypothetical protein